MLDIDGRRGFFLGSLVGLAAATVGVDPIFAVVRPWHIFVFIAFAYSLYSQTRSSVSAFKVLTLDVAMFLFVIGSLTVEIINGEELNYRADLTSAISPLYYFLAYIAIRLVMSQNMVLPLLRGLIWPSIPVGLLAAAQTLSLGGVSEMVLSWASSEGGQARLELGSLTRATSLIGHWTGLGAYFSAVVAACMCVRIIERTNAERPSRAVPIALVISLMGTVSTLTVSVVFVSLLVVLSAWKRAGFGLKATAVAGAAGLATVSIFGVYISTRVDQQSIPNTALFADLPAWVPNTLIHRMNIWYAETIPTVSERPFLGWGNGSYGFDDPSRLYSPWLQWESAESQWFWLLVTYGLIVTLVFIVVLGSLLFELNKVWKSDCRAWWVGPVLTLVLLHMITAFTVPVFTNRGLPVILWALAATIIGYGLSAAERTSNSPVLKTPDLVHRMTRQGPVGKLPWG